MRKKIGKTFACMLAVILVFALAACGQGASSAGGSTAAAGGSSGGSAAANANADRVIKVGMPAPLSGASAGTGSDMERGIAMAIEELNAAGGVLGHQLELVKGDVEGQEPSTVTTVVNRLLTKDNVDIMVTGYANPSLVEADIVEQYKTPYLLYGYAQAQERIFNEKADQYHYLHNCIPSYQRYQTDFPELVEKLIADKKFEPQNKKVAVIMSQNEYSLYCGEGMRDTFKEMGWEVVVDETIPFDKFTEFEPILAKIRSEKPAIILYTDHTASNAATFMKSFLQDPTPSLLFLQATPSYAEFIEIMDGQQDGVIWNYAASMLGEKGDAFKAAYQAKYGEKPNPYAGFTYDAMMLAADAMTKAGDPFDKEKVNEVLSAADYSYEGNIGTYRFDPKTYLSISGEGGIPFVTYQESGSEHIPISPSELAQAEFVLPPWYEGALAG